MNLDLQDRKLWIGGGVIATLMILAIGWFFLVHPRLTDASTLRQQSAAAETQNSGLESQDAALVEQSKHLTSYQAQLRKALQALPAYSSAAYFSSTLAVDAQATGVKITSIEVASPTTSGTSTTGVTTPSGPNSTQITVAVSGKMASGILFLEAVRNGPRPATITSVSTAGSGATTTLTASLSIFNAPQSAAEQEQLQKLLAPAK